MKPKNKPKHWKEKLLDLIDEEIELASGKLIDELHHSGGDCRMNDILAFVEKLIKNAERLPK